MSLLLSWGRHARLTVVVANKIDPIPSWNLTRNSEFLTCPLYSSARIYGLLSSRASVHGLRGCARWVSAVGIAFSLLYEISETLERTLTPSCQYGCHNEKQKDGHYSSSDHVHLAHNSHKLLRNLLAAISLFPFYLDPIQIIEKKSGFPRAKRFKPNRVSSQTMMKSDAIGTGEPKRGPEHVLLLRQLEL